MNYPSMRLHIVQDFARVQLLGEKGRLERFWEFQREFEAKLLKRSQDAYEQDGDNARVNRGRYVPCPICGRDVECRPGSVRLIHTGVDRQRCAGGYLRSVQG